MDINETIAAIATGPGEGGVGIVRMSGEGALKIARALFRLQVKGRGDSPCPFLPRRLYYGRLYGGDGGVIDDAMAVFMPGPKSFTGEDVVEFHCHGGALILANVLRAVLAMGVRCAHPGEFTRRAFCNGKMDLARAEAVLDLIRAGTESALSSARGRFTGKLSDKINNIKAGLLRTLARIEAELDFAEEDIEITPNVEIASSIDEARGGVMELLATYDRGRALRDGVKVLILGRPNVGKSSLLNILLKEERAIVTPVSGTTRDLIEEVVNINGLPVRLMDTAGLRESECEVESIGIERARERVGEAELILFVVDISAGDLGEDRELLAGLAGMEGKKRIVVANKKDLIGEGELGAALKNFEHERVALVSARGEEGITELEEAIGSVSVGKGSEGAELALGESITSARHKAALEETLEGLERVGSALGSGITRDIVSGELRWSVDKLGEITGETTTDDILDIIFSEFCIGK